MQDTEPDNKITIYCDGLVEPVNPGGWGCWAWLAIGPNGRRLRDARACHGRGPEITNNLMEYLAVLNALRYALSRTALLVERHVGLTVYSDSQLVIRQVNGEWACNSPNLLPLRDEVVRLAERFRLQGIALDFAWIPREQNTEADALTRRAYAEARGRREAA